ncbi:unnamed protein product [Closterium sp. NIES-53]
MTLRPPSVPLRVPLPAPPESSLPEVPDPESDRAHAASPTVSRLLATAVTDPSFESSAASALVAEQLDFAAASRLDYATALVSESESASPPSVGGECALCTDVLEDRQEDFECLAAAGEAAAGFSACLQVRYVAQGFSQRQGVDYFHTFSPTLKMTTLRVLQHIAAQRDYELHSLDFSTAFLQGCLHKEIWLRRPSGFTGTTLAALGFAPSTADPSLFLRTDTSLPPFYVLVYITPDRARRTITLTQSHMVQQVLQRFGFQFSSPQLTPLSTGYSLSAPPSDESPPGSLHGSRTSGMGLVLGGRGLVVLTGHTDASWLDDLATRRSSQGYTFSFGSGSVSWKSTRSSSFLSSSCEAEIYAGAVAA